MDSASNQNVRADDDDTDTSQGQEDDVGHCCYYCLETNPLLIDTVLYQLSHYVGFEDLKSLRLVHTSWNRAITPRLKKCCRVVFRPVSQQEVDELKLLGPHEEKTIWQGICCSQIANDHKTMDISYRIVSFLKVARKGFEIFGNSPFSEFKLIDFPFDSDVGKDFFQVIGRNIKALDIRVNRKGAPRTQLPLPLTFGGDFYPNLLLLKAPFLRKLVLFPYPGLDSALFSQTIPYLEGLHFKEWASKELLYPHSFLENLFANSIKLHQIWISIGLENCKSVENILIALATSGRYSYLSRLHIAYLRLNHLEILLELALQRRGRLRLTSFRIEALAHDVPTSMFESFLRTQSINMEELYCRRFLGTSKFGKFTFPRMIALRKLDCELSTRQVMPLKCNVRFPKLETLNLFGTCCQVFSYDGQFCGNKISGSLTSLHFRPGLIVKGSISGLAQHFPCLKSLTLSIISNEDMMELFQCWEMLEDLELYFGDGIVNIDSILTGIPSRACSRLLEELKEGRDSSGNLIEDNKDMILSYENEISLRNFKCLKTLHFEYNAFLMSRNGPNPETQGSNTDLVEESSNDPENNVIQAPVQVEAEPYWDESYLPSNLTGYFALANMKSLRRISLPECLLTADCCNYLIQTLDLVNWTFCSEASDIVPARKI